jgi:hypothetical protein
LRGAVALLLLQHVGHMLWLVNPAMGDAPGVALATVTILTALWALWLAAGLASRHNLGYGEGD